MRAGIALLGVKCATVAVSEDLPSDAGAFFDPQMTWVKLHVFDLDTIVFHFRAGSVVMLLRLLVDNRHRGGPH